MGGNPKANRTMMRMRWVGGAVALGVVLAVVLPARRAEANFHLVQIQQLMAGLNGDPSVQFIELQMEADDQKCQGTGEIADFEHEACRPVGPGAMLVFFDAAGNQTAEFIFPSNTAIGDIGRSILIATQQFASLSTMPEPDVIMPAHVVPNSGKVCYRNRVDAPFFVNLCLSYGAFTGSTEGFGPPAPALPITGNASLKRVNFNFDNSAFALGTPAPSNNCGAVSGGRACLKVTKSSSVAGGTVSSSPAGITCASSCPETSAPFTASTVVTLTATPAVGFVFVGWSGGACTGTGACMVTMNASTSVTATFGPSAATLRVSKAGTGSGAVTSTPAGIACESTCSASFANGTAVTLTASPAGGSAFAGWSGGGCNAAVTCTVTIRAATSVTAMFLTESGSGTGPLVAAVLPSSRSVQVGTPATAFVTIVNTAESPAPGVGITLRTAIPVGVDFQTTNPTTNAVSGTANTPVDILAKGSQTFVIALTPTAVFGPTDVEFSFAGSNAAPVARLTGINTLLLSASSTPVPDVVALGATLSNDGIANVNGATGTGVFSVATVNVGAGEIITASVDTGGAGIPVGLRICETNPATSICMNPPIQSATNSTTTFVAATATPTFAIFITGTGRVPFDAAANRIFVRFKDAGGVTRGSTSVAVRTQ